MLGGAGSVWAVDIGQASLKAAKLQKVGRRLQVQALDLVEFPRESAQRGPERQAEVRNALQTFVSRNDLKNSKLLFSVPSSSSYVRFVNLPPVAKKDVPKVVRYEARQQIPFPLEEIIWDYSQTPGRKAPGEEIQIGLYAVRREVVDQLMNELGDKKLSVDLVQMSSLALYNFCRHEGLLKESGIVLSIGASYTDIIIADEETLLVRSLPLAGDDLTRVLSERFKITFLQAENLKHRVGRAPAEQAKKILSAMLPVMRNLAGEIQRTLGYYRAQVRNIKFEKVIALGSAFKLPGLRQYLERELGMPVVTVRGLSGITIGEGVNKAVIDSSLGQFAVALGLGAQALGETESKINFVPRSIRQEQLIKTKLPFAVASVGVLSVILLTIWGLASLQVHGLKSEVDSAQRTLGQMAEYEGQIAAASEVSLLRQGLNSIRALAQRSERDRWVNMWDALGKLPPEVAIKSFETEAIQFSKLKEPLLNSPNAEVRAISQNFPENMVLTMVTAEAEIQLGGTVTRDNVFGFIDSKVVGVLIAYSEFAGLHQPGAPRERGNMLDFTLRWVIIP